MSKMIFTCIFFFFSLSLVFSQDFVYTPTNPAFGGSYFNYSWLLNSAQVQNSTTDPNSTDRTSAANRDPLEDFKTSLNRQILNQLSRSLVQDQFGTGSEFQTGTYTIGDYTIDITDSLNGVLITIIDLTTGNRSVIEVPNL